MSDPLLPQIPSSSIVGDASDPMLSSRCVSRTLMSGLSLPSTITISGTVSSGWVGVVIAELLASDAS